MSTTHTDQTLRLLAQRLFAAKAPVLWASGGKDSVVLLHLCRPWAGKLRVLHATNDDGWPGVTELLRDQCRQWGYRQVDLVPPWRTFPEYVAQFGWPVNMVPTALEGATAVAPSPFRYAPVKLASWWHCTYVRVLYPLLMATEEGKNDLVLTGSRNSDMPGFVTFAQDVAPAQPRGWTRLNPLSAWTTEELWTYIDAQQLVLPDIYQWKREATYPTVDCMSCTWQPQHWATLKEHYPDEYAKRWPHVAQVYNALQGALRDEQQEMQMLPRELNVLHRKDC